MKTLTTLSNDTARRRALISSEQLDLAIQSYRGDSQALTEIDREIQALVRRLESVPLWKAK